MKNGRKISKDIVKAWFKTVLNPMIDGLLLIQSYLKEDNYTWDSNYKNFVEIKPLLGLIEYKYLANYDQIVAIGFPELFDLQIEYARIMNDFNSSCNTLFSHLVKSEELQKLLEDKINEYEKFSDISEIDIKYLKGSKVIEWIASYLINNRKELPFNNILKDIWNRDIVVFYNILKSNELNKYAVELKRKRDEFEIILNKAFRQLNDFRNELSLTHGVPIVE